jgi:NADH-quinone oxidoreductase subunit J
MTDALLLGAINWHTVFFFLFATIACAFGAGVLFTSNIVRMAFYLVISLAATAALFLLAGSEFVGAMQIMIYVGGTLVLLIFGVMLTAQEAFVSMKTRGGEWILAVIVGASFFILLANTALSIPGWRQPHPESARHLAQVRQAEQTDRDPTASDEQKAAAWAAVKVPQFRPQQRTTTQMGFALTGARVDVDEPHSPVIRRGMTGYLLAFEAVGLHLLIVLVGAAYLSRSKRFVGGRARPVASFEVRERKRSWMLSVKLVSGMIFYTLLAVATVAGMEHFQHEFPLALVNPPQWLTLVTSLLFLLNVLLLAVVWGWQRWGVVALYIVPFVQAGLLMQNGLQPAWAIGLAVLELLYAGAITALVCLGKPNAWSQMD